MKKAIPILVSLFALAGSAAFFLRVEICEATKNVCVAIPEAALSSVEVHTGSKFSIQGKEALGVCKIISNVECQTKTLDVLKKNNLAKLQTGQVDLAVVPSHQINSDSNLKVLLSLASDNRYLLATRPDLSLEDGKVVIDKIENFLNTTRKPPGPVRSIYDELPHRLRFGEPLKHFVTFDRTYPLHSALAEKMLEPLSEPLDITYGINSCNKKTNRCVVISDVPTEDYRASSDVSDLGMGIVPYISPQLNSQNDFLVMKSANALGKIWPHDAKTLTDLLIPLLKHPNDEVKEQAIFALAKVEPVQQITITALLKQTRQIPEKRKPFEDGSTGMLGRKSYVNQAPISNIAANILVKIAPAQALPELRKLIDSEEEGLQNVAIDALGSHIQNAKQALRQELPRGEKNNITIENLPQDAQQTVKFLISKQNYVTEENKKSISSILKQYLPNEIEDKTILALAKDLYIKTECSQEADNQNCINRKLRNAIYEIRAIGSAAAKTEVFEGIHYAFVNGEKRDKSLIAKTLQKWSDETEIPDKLVEALIREQNPDFASAIATIANNQPKWWDKAYHYIMPFVSDEERFVRVTGVAALGILADNNLEAASELQSKIIALVENEPDGYAKHAMIPSLGVFAEKNPVAMNLLIDFLSYRQDIIEDFYIKISGRDRPLPRMLQDKTLPLSADDIFQIRSATGKTLYNLNHIPPEAISALEKYYVNEIKREDCEHIMHRAGSLNMVRDAYRKHTGSSKALVKPILEVLKRDDPECLRNMLPKLEHEGEEADASLTILASKIDKTNLKKNGQIFGYAKKLDTKAAHEFLSKFSEYNPYSEENKGEEVLKIPDLANAYYRLK